MSSDRDHCDAASLRLCSSVSSVAELRSESRRQPTCRTIPSSSARTQRARAPLDFQEHLADLEAQGLLVRVDRADQQGHRAAAARALAVRRRHRRKTSAARSSSPTSSTRRAGATTCRSPSARSPPRRGSTRSGMGKPVEEIGDDLDAAPSRTDRAGRRSSRRACQQVVITGDALREPGGGLARLPVPISTPGFDCRAVPHGDAVRHARSRERHTEHGHLPRRAQGDRPARACAWSARVGGAGGYLHWLKYRDRKEPMPIAIVLGCAPVVFFTGPQKLAVDSDELDGRGRARRRADPQDEVRHHRSRRAGGRGDRHRRPDRYRGARARGAVRREQRLRRARSLQHADARHRDHAQALARVHGDHQPGHAERIERREESRLRAAVPRAPARQPVASRACAAW